MRMVYEIEKIENGLLIRRLFNSFIEKELFVKGDFNFVFNVFCFCSYFG